MKFQIHIYGKHINDILIAVEKVKEQLEQGYKEGLDSNNSGGYYFKEK